MDDTGVKKLNIVETQYGINPVIDRRVTRKFDFHILPWLLAFVDRSSVGNAKIYGLTKDLKLTGNKFNVALVDFTPSDALSHWAVSMPCQQCLNIARFPPNALDHWLSFWFWSPRDFPTDSKLVALSWFGVAL